MTVTEIISLLHKATADLSRIHQSDAWQRLTESPQAHPKIEEIMGDAQHYITELRLRVSQSLEGPNLTPGLEQDLVNLFNTRENSPAT